MEFPIRYAGEDDWRAITDLDGTSFGFRYDEQSRAEARLELDPNRCLVACDADRIVGVSADMPFLMTVPGGDIETAGITWVSVDVSYRRRGILRALLERQLRDRAADGLSTAILTAAEGGIYARYGFGAAERVRRTVVERRAASLLRPLPDAGVRSMTTEQAGELLPARYEHWRRGVPGAVSRDPNRWQFLLLDSAWQRDGRSGLFHLVHAEGYVSYRISEDWNDGLPRHVCHVVDHAMSTPQAHAGLWQTLLGMDLVGTIESTRIPVDDVLPHLLADGRAVRTAADIDGLWVRPLDVAALLSARTYAVEVDVVLGVRDELFGDGRYRLRGGPDGASCERVDSVADIELPVGDLGAVSLGGTRLVQLARAGTVTGRAELVTRLDRALLADRAPQHGTNF